MSNSNKSNENGKKIDRGMTQDGAMPPAPRLQKPQPAPQQTPTPTPPSSSKK